MLAVISVQVQARFCLCRTWEEQVRALFQAPVQETPQYQSQGAEVLGSSIPRSWEGRDSCPCHLSAFTNPESEDAKGHAKVNSLLTAFDHGFQWDASIHPLKLTAPISSPVHVATAGSAFVTSQITCKLQPAPLCSLKHWRPLPQRNCGSSPLCWTALQQAHRKAPTSTKCSFGLQLHKRQSCETANSTTPELGNTENYKAVPKHCVGVPQLS